MTETSRKKASQHMTNWFNSAPRMSSSMPIAFPKHGKARITGITAYCYKCGEPIDDGYFRGAAWLDEGGSSLTYCGLMFCPTCNLLTRGQGHILCRPGQVPFFEIVRSDALPRPWESKWASIEAYLSSDMEDGPPEPRVEAAPVTVQHVAPVGGPTASSARFAAILAVLIVVLVMALA